MQRVALSDSWKMQDASCQQTSVKTENNWQDRIVVKTSTVVFKRLSIQQPIIEMFLFILKKIGLEDMASADLTSGNLQLQKRIRVLPRGKSHELEDTKNFTSRVMFKLRLNF
jgi:hypothetical protein